MARDDKKDLKIFQICWFCLVENGIWEKNPFCATIPHFNCYNKDKHEGQL